VALTVTDAELDGERVSLRAEQGTIVAIGAEVAPEPGDEVLDAEGRAIVPGLVNGHGHAAMTLFRGFGDDLPLDVWLQTRIWPAEARLDADAVYWGTRLACVEMVRSGTTRFFDMYWYAVDAARAARDVGIRMVASQIVIEMEGAPPGTGPDDAAEGWTALGEVDPLIEPCLAAHAIYTTSDELLRRIAATADELGTRVQIHLSETEQEVLDCVAAHGMRPAHYLDSVGLLHDRMVLAHGVWLDDDELALVAERGATVVTNPVSNMKLAVGRAFPYPEAKAAGLALGLGTDGAASNNTLDLLSDLKVLALLQKHSSGDPSTLPAAHAWELARGSGSPALGGTPVAVGQPADLLLIDRDVVEMTPGGLVDNLVYAASGAVVDSTVVAGTVVMRHRQVEGEAEVRAKAHEHAARIRGE
jgi:5-methylthioadenosine/S-adenosylhomocysteine deaminase